MNVLGEDYTHDHQPEQDEEAFCQDLRMNIDTLIILSPSLSCPAKENIIDEEPRALENIAENLPEQVYVNSVAQRFPLAASAVVAHLGKLNWDQYNHMLRLQRIANEQELEMAASRKARTIFHDSVLGSSVSARSEPDQNPKTVYALSSVSSRAEASHRRLPPLPPQARSGQVFACPVSNKTEIPINQRMEVSHSVWFHCL